MRRVRIAFILTLVKWGNSRPMRFETPTTSKEAATLMAKARGSAFVLAGGTDLLVRMRTGMIEPDLVVDIKHIAAMQSIDKSATGFRIGAAVSAAVMGENAALKKAWPGVVESANLIGSDQIQSLIVNGLRHPSRSDSGN